MLTWFKILTTGTFEVVGLDDEDDEELRVELPADRDGALTVNRLVLPRELHVTCQVKHWTLQQGVVLRCKDYADQTPISNDFIL